METRFKLTSKKPFPFEINAMQKWLTALTGSAVNEQDAATCCRLFNAAIAHKLPKLLLWVIVQEQKEHQREMELFEATCKYYRARCFGSSNSKKSM